MSTSAAIGGGAGPAGNQSRLVITPSPTEIEFDPDSTTPVPTTVTLSSNNSAYTILSSSLVVTDQNNDPVSVSKNGQVFTFDIDDSITGSVHLAGSLIVRRNSDSMEFTDTNSRTIHVALGYYAARLSSTPTTLASFDADTDLGDLGVWSGSASIEFDGDGMSRDAYIGVPDGPSYEFRSGLLFVSVVSLGTIGDFEIFRLLDFDDIDNTSLTVDITEV